jgi:uncharacterized protein
MYHSDMFLHEYKPAKLHNALAVISFPSVGLVSSIASNYIVRSMKLERIATIISKDFPPYAILHDGVPSPPVRIYAGKRDCPEAADGEDCEQILVIMSEFTPRADLIKPLADIIIDWCQKKGVKMILALEGINTSEEQNGDNVLGAETSHGVQGRLEKYGITPMREGMVSGLSGVILSEGDRLGMDVLCLLGPAKAEMPDARGAARLLEKVGMMLPEIKLDPAPLFKEAELIEGEMKVAMESVKQTRKPGEESLLYG